MKGLKNREEMEKQKGDNKEHRNMKRHKHITSLYIVKMIICQLTERNKEMY